MGNTTSTPEASRWRSVGAAGSSSGGISRVASLAITASEASASIQQPSCAIPSGVTLWPASRRPLTTVRAERIETWCSTLRPPKTTPTWAMKGSPWLWHRPHGAGGSLPRLRNPHHPDPPLPALHPPNLGEEGEQAEVSPLSQEGGRRAGREGPGE